MRFYWRLSALICATRAAGAGPRLAAFTASSLRRPQVGENRKSLTFALRFRAADRTLTEDEASEARDAAVRRAAEQVGAVLRG